MKIKEIAQAIEEIAPLGLAQEWDNVGLLIGDPAKSIKTILLTIDTTKAVVQEAKTLKADLILAYHPIIWDGLKRITADGATANIYELIRAGISVFCIHTALDTVAGGVNDALADILGMDNPKPIGDYVADPAGPQYKVITFVPDNAVNEVAEALYAAGAGAIGSYSHCGFQTAGVGTFKPLTGAHPAIGKIGQIERVDEIRLETVVSAEKVSAVIAALRKSHPYETPAFDVFRHYNVENKLGLGRMGTLRTPLSIEQIITNVKKATGAAAAGIVGQPKRIIRTAAVCAGTCGKLLNTVIAAGCDLYLTGELKHHQALAAQEAGLTCICLSHTVSERFALKNLANRLKKRLKTCTIRISKKDKDPFIWKEI
ncbi:MAG TPA: Nif3-like dinuclear metal center hexameric protein [Anaerohalosphaeraceae bacterium]|nr:Nif3-like dinuclear metal center hexameric protein [Phycisphaerae bacterium]HOK96805.1 Nif3-like dinuclear metal center hexameric protein [Anaerohalosphaeraceae bacterium]HOL32141.1 Nif3-like dinuclear metal center hexameric protein [Anaerohalosphaeraceae bacterium]HOM76681.1 Nif3-like dinuclear metal center hexameric protein [Anaerohalosphaeraceae bacterium]HPC65067.1 Nif3-like dinuclear metal center hexameric protein [Anaerohalosphaeraceae bacterium]